MQTDLRNNSFWLLLARVLAQTLAVIFTAIIARKLGVTGFGHFAFIASIILIGNTFTNFGTDTFLVREIARLGQVTEIASQALTLQLILSALYCAAILFFRDTPLLIYSLALFPLAVFSVNNALLRALNRMDLFCLLSIANGIFQIIAALFSSDILALCVFLLVGQLLITVFSFSICFASLLHFSLFPLKSFYPIFKWILPFATLTLLLVFIQRLGVLSVSVLLGDSATGLFSSTFRIVEGLKLGHYALLGALLPAISRGSSDSWKSFRKAFVFLLSVSMILALLLMLFSTPLLFILYGNEFTQAADSLGLLGWSLLPYTVISFISYELVARQLEGVVVKAASVSLMVDLVLYLWLITSKGFTGAIWAAVLGETLQAGIFGVFYISIRHSFTSND